MSKGTTKERAFDLTGAIIDYEMGALDDAGMLDLFSRLVKSGAAWTLQGHYGRTAAALIDAGYLAKDGTILRGIGEED